MKNLTNDEFRKVWFEFWKERGHDIIESAPLIPINDPTLLWINAGIAPLKKYFDGSVIPNNRKIANIQKCIRTNDIENVGYTMRHATFFEMMGNFSIGDYFKKEAITWSWEFLTKYLLFEKEKIYVTIYPNDEEAYNIWRNLGVEEDHIIKLETNFWEIGVGPSGPDSEIFYDRGEKFDPQNLGIRLLKEEIENDRYIEVWNNVFSMYNADPNLNREEYKELPNKNIDTGMGLERMLMVLQQKDSIFETDVFKPIIEKIEELSNIKYIDQPTFRVISDHIRTLTFALSDGANFGNNGRDYVLRRLLRRAVRFGKKIGLEKPFMWKLVDSVVEVMKNAYPNLFEKIDIVREKIKIEEELFHSTLIQGEKKFMEIIKNSSNKIISGEDAFKLYDTYGFPFELTFEMAKELGYEVSYDEFLNHMQHQQQLARNSRQENNSMNLQNEQLLNFHLDSKFVGYDEFSTNTKIIALFDGSQFIDSLKSGYVVLENTPFYVESGGQVEDSGYLLVDNEKIEVLDLFKGPNKQHFHKINSNHLLKIGDPVTANIDVEKRLKIMKNHSATHLLQTALKQVLDDNITQAGSRIDEQTLRFDFSYDKRITDNDIIDIENKVNEKIATNIPIKTEILSLDEAIKSGAMALFEDKYEQTVRVLSIADSKELCGGTHVKNVSEIEKFAIKNFESKGNNLYRIEATTSDNIESELFLAIKPYNDEMIKLLNKAKKIVNNANVEGIELNFNIQINNEIPTSYKDIIFNMYEMDTVKKAVQDLEKEYFEIKKRNILSDLSFYTENLEQINDINSIIIKVDNQDLDILKSIIAELANKYDRSFIFIINVLEKNANFLARSKIEELHVGSIIKDISLKNNGNGGGSSTYAQGGGSNIENISEIINEVKNLVKNVKK